MYGDGFSYIYTCGVLLFPGIIALMTVSVTANYLSGVNRTKYNLQGVVLSLVIILAGNYLFIPQYGIYAASLVSTVGYLTYALFMLVNFKKHAACSWQELLLARKNDWAGLASVRAFLRIKNDLP